MELLQGVSYDIFVLDLFIKSKSVLGSRNVIQWITFLEMELQGEPCAPFHYCRHYSHEM